MNAVYAGRQPLSHKGGPLLRGTRSDVTSGRAGVTTGRRTATLLSPSEKARPCRGAAPSRAGRRWRLAEELGQRLKGRPDQGADGPRGVARRPAQSPGRPCCRAIVLCRGAQRRHKHIQDLRGGSPPRHRGHRLFVACGCPDDRLPLPPRRHLLRHERDARRSGGAARASARRGRQCRSNRRGRVTAVLISCHLELLEKSPHSKTRKSGGERPDSVSTNAQGVLQLLTPRHARQQPARGPARHRRREHGRGALSFERREQPRQVTDELHGNSHHF